MNKNKKAERLRHAPQITLGAVIGTSLVGGRDQSGRR